MFVSKMPEAAKCCNSCVFTQLLTHLGTLVKKQIHEDMGFCICTELGAHIGVWYNRGAHIHK